MKKKNNGKKASVPVARRIMPIGMLSRRLGDLFGNSVYLAESIDDTFGTLAWAAEENLIEGISAYDDDIAPWTADNRGRVVDQQDQLLLREMQDFLEENSLVLSSFGCDLTRDAMFRNGALTNPDDGIRQLAFRKIERAACIAKALGTRNFRLFIGREGYEEPLGVNWKTAFSTLAEGLNGVTRFINAKSGFESIELMTGYSRRLRGHLYMGSPMQAAFMMSQLNQPGFWRLCIESDDLSYMPAYSVLAATNSLAYMPFGGEDGWNWNAHIANTVAIMKMLSEFNWSGNAECLFAPMRSEADEKERELTKRQFITNSMTALTLAAEQVKRLGNGWNTGLSPSESGLMAVTLCTGMDVDDLLRRTVTRRDAGERQDVQANREPAEIPKKQTVPEPQNAMEENDSNDLPDASNDLLHNDEQPPSSNEGKFTAEALLLAAVTDAAEEQYAQNMQESSSEDVAKQDVVDDNTAEAASGGEAQPQPKSERFRKYRNKRRIRQQQDMAAKAADIQMQPAPPQPLQNDVNQAAMQRPEQLPVEQQKNMPEHKFDRAKVAKAAVRRRYSRYARKK